MEALAADAVFREGAVNEGRGGGDQVAVAIRGDRAAQDVFQIALRDIGGGAAGKGFGAVVHGGDEFLRTKHGCRLIRLHKADWRLYFKIVFL